MTREVWSLFWIALVSGSIIAFGAAYGTWRTRDRDIAKLANLDALASSGNLTAEQRKIFAERLAQSVDHLMKGDQISRPFRVQQVVYVVGFLIALGCVYLSFDALTGASWWIRAPLLAVAAISIWLVVRITGVAPQEWALPRLLQREALHTDHAATAYGSPAELSDIHHRKQYRSADAPVAGAPT